MDAIAEYLIRKETITGKEFMKILHAVQKGIEIPENLDDLVIPEEPESDTVSFTPEETPEREEKTGNGGKDTIVLPSEEKTAESETFVDNVQET